MRFTSKKKVPLNIKVLLNRANSQAKKNINTTEFYLLNKKCVSASDVCMMYASQAYTTSEVKMSKTVPDASSTCDGNELKPMVNAFSSEDKEHNIMLLYAAATEGTEHTIVLDAFANEGTEHKTVLDAISSKGTESKIVLDAFASESTENEVVLLDATAIDEGTENKIVLGASASKGTENKIVLDEAANEIKENKLVLHASASKGTEQNIVPLDASASDGTENKIVLDEAANKIKENKLVLHAGASKGTGQNIVPLDASTSEATENKIVLLDAAASNVTEKTLLLDAPVGERAEHNSVLDASATESTEYKTVMDTTASECSDQMTVLDSASRECEMCKVEADIPVLVSIGVETAESVSEAGLIILSKSRAASPVKVKAKCEVFRREAITLTLIHMMYTQVKFAIQDCDYKGHLFRTQKKNKPLFNYENVPATYVPRLLASRRRVRFLTNGELIPANAGCNHSSLETFDELLKCKEKAIN